MPEPMVVEVMRAHKAAILAEEDAVMRDMADHWLEVERSLEGQISALAQEATRLAEEGTRLTSAQLDRMERYQRLMWQVRAETGKYVKWSSESVQAYQLKMGEQGLTHAADAIRAAYTDVGIVGETFDLLHVDAITAMIGFAGDGSPLRTWLEAVHAEAANGITQALIEGIVKGINPEKVARAMVNGLALGLQTAFNTARTESLRAYRTASLMQYQASGLVAGYKRLAAHDERVCPGCLFTDGMYIGETDAFDEHNQGRCTAVPVLIGIDPPTWQSGQDWFALQSESVQMGILGPGRFEAWKNGASLSSMVKRVEDPVWGGAYVPTPMSELNQ